MERIKQDMDELVSYDAKKEIIKDIGQEDLLKLFEDYKPKYRPVVRKKSPLDQQISVGITAEEKQMIVEEVRALKKAGDNVTISALVRSRSTGEIDIAEWRERAVVGLRELDSERWDKPGIQRNLKKLYSAYDELDLDSEDDQEDEIVIRQRIDRYERMLEELERPTARRGSRMSGRVTFNEANHIRWRAGRLTLTVADYMRFLIFGHLPFTEFDRHLSVDARKRFYVAIIDVAENGWGEPPHVEECENCARYAQEVKELRRKLDKLQKMSR